MFRNTIRVGLTCSEKFAQLLFNHPEDVRFEFRNGAIFCYCDGTIEKIGNFDMPLFYKLRSWQLDHGYDNIKLFFDILPELCNAQAAVCGIGSN